MTSPLLNGLRLLELLVDGRSTQAQVAAALGVNRSTVLRSARLLESQGWLVRLADRWELGPRALTLGATSPARVRAERAAQVAHAVAGATGLDTVVGQLAGRSYYLLAHVPGTVRMNVGTAHHGIPLAAYAGAQCLLIDLEPGQLAEYLGPEPYPAIGPRTLTSWRQVCARLEQIRAGTAAVELEESGPGHGCVALPWRFSAESPLMSIACIATAEVIAASRDRIEKVLRAAIAPGAVLTVLSPLAAGGPA